MGYKSVLITDTVHPLLIEGLLEKGIPTAYLPTASYEEVLLLIEKHTVLVINSRVIADRQMMEAGKRLKMIIRLGSGLEVMDRDFAATKNIQCFNTPEGNRDAVAEFTIGLILCLLRNIYKSAYEVSDLKWIREPNRGVELSALTVGLLGYGHTGEATAKRLASFGCKILAHDKYRSGFHSNEVKEVSLDDLFSHTDILSLHLPLTDETKFLVDEVFLQRFNKNICLINTSRGEIIKTEALIGARRSGKVIAAALDVLENEKLNSLTPAQKANFDKLNADHNVIITPHIAGWTYQSKEKIAQAALSRILSQEG